MELVLCDYSSRNASIGLILTALCAGIKPIKVPKLIIMNNTPKMYGMGTVGLAYGNPSEGPEVKALMAAKTAAPKMIPIMPAMSVKKTDSKIICIRTSEGVAPMALRIPNSLVRSFTDINKMFPMPITPAIMVASPTIKDKKVSPLENPKMRFKDFS